MWSRRYARLFVLVFGIPLVLALLAACGAGTTGSGGATTKRPQTKLLLTYQGHSERATAGPQSPDGKGVVPGSLDKTLQIWRATTGKTLLTYRGHTKQVTSLAWSPDSTSIVSGSFDKTVQVWDASTGKVRYIYDGYNVAIARIDYSKVVLPDLIFFVAWSHNGQRIAAVIQIPCSD